MINLMHPCWISNNFTLKHFKRLLLSWRYNTNTEESVSHDTQTVWQLGQHTHSRHDQIHLFLAEAKFSTLLRANTRALIHRHKGVLYSHNRFIIVCSSVLIGWGSCEVSPWLFSVIMAFDNTGYKHHCHTPQLRRTTDWPRDRRALVY